ncbi:hypothetical protein SS1G_10857 [Sclerotinia sclerotiorum 1980 UF-70]|uniref:Major facilitator superfamily (MFS) profile domain-containing protein n=1 Tax=Sclerotinia sclerotiorum (strain ATCC 18683 / 1980 / Ss-1) TaxID=665079 RepID=A7EZU0_SCLS1|nr:hypothetical protein SS1G_10857 [Sclerotinia sclerotiorum 1980 UF-70]EDN94982.1 hypothetical protein SS1G_10857 [Sclerotinia sclerotiorum 1980 UF-70]
MSAVMIVQTGLIYNVQYHTELKKACGIGAAIVLFIFEGAFTIGFQATVWVYPSEILPLRLRQRGSSVSTACNWIFNYMIVQITPIALNNIGYKTYIIFGVLNACWVPIIYLWFPETKGLELEDVDGLFERGEGVGVGTGKRGVGKRRAVERGVGGSTLSDERVRIGRASGSRSGVGVSGSVSNNTGNGKGSEEDIGFGTSEQAERVERS